MNAARRGGGSAPWRAFADELSRWRDAGRVVDFWWRDDDAGQPDPALSRLLALAQATSTPLALAVIPIQFEPRALDDAGSAVSILQHGSDHRNRAAAGEKKTEFPAAESPAAAIVRLAAAQRRLALEDAGLAVSILQHGSDHRNRAAAGEKKTEFPAAEPPADAIVRLAVAQQRLSSQAGFVPVLAPPWNRLPDTLAPHLAAAGFRGLSRYGARGAVLAAPGVVQVNTHVDLVAWRAGRGFAGEEACLGAAVRHLAAKREGGADAGEATGWLSHHAVHDDAAWVFLERLLETTRQSQGVRWLGAQELFNSP